MTTGVVAEPVTEHLWLPVADGHVALHVTDAPGTPARGVAVLLPPVGYPYWSAYLTCRALAEELARRGVATVRVDYLGTGNATGSGDDPGDWLARWQESAQAVLDAVRSSTDLPVGTVGFQLGSALALRTEGPLAFHVAWEPLRSGRSFVRSLRLLGRQAPEGEEFSGLTLGGSPFNDTTLEALRTADLSPTASPEVLLATGADLEVPSPSVLEQPAEHAEPPTAAVRDLAERVASSLPEPSSGDAGRLVVAGAVDRLVVPGAGVEHPVTLSSGLTGVAGDPDGGPTRTVVVFLNSGSEMNAGPGRAWLDYARTLQAAGTSTLRLDWSGWGEGPSRPTPGRPYDAHCLPETRRAIADLHAEGREVVLLGLCAGAWVALAVAREGDVPGLAGVVAINPQLYWREGHPVEATIEETIERRTPIRAHEARWGRRGLWTALDLVGITSREGRWLRDLHRSRVPTLLLFAEGDEGLVFLRNRLARRLRRTTGEHVRVEVVEGIDHPMHQSWLRGPVRRAIVDFAARTG